MRPNLKVADITTGNIYAVRIGVLVHRETGQPYPGTRDQLVDAFERGDAVPGNIDVAATVLRRDRETGAWKVRTADGSEYTVLQRSFLARWDDHLANMDLDAAADRLRDIAIDLGWVEADEALGSSVASTLFGGPVGTTSGGKVTVELDVEQAHLVADVLRDHQSRSA